MSIEMRRLPELTGPEGLFSDGDWVETKDQDPEGEIRLVQLADIGEGVFRDRSNRFLTQQKAKELECTYLRPGDILIARMPEPLGRACIFPDIGQPAVTAVDVCILRPDDGTDRRWLMHAINAPQFRRRVLSLQSGTTRKRISRMNLSTIELPLRPYQEQVLIREEVDKQFTRLDSAASFLETTWTKLERYTAALLEKAVLGLLSEDDKKPFLRGGSKARTITEAGNHASLPPGWRWVSLGDVAPDKGAITDGPFGSNLKTEHYTATGPRVIRLANIGKGVFNDEYAHISPAHYERLRKHDVQPGDLVVAALGQDAPRACVIPPGLGSAIVKADCIRVRPAEGVASPRYLNLALNSSVAKTQAVIHGVGRPRLNLAKIKALRIPLPPVIEQERIVGEVERRLSIVTDMNSEIQRALAMSRVFRQAVLRSAFSGTLIEAVNM